MQLNKAIVETPEYILISIEFESNYKASWEELQEQKNKTHNQLRFVEVYPLEEEVINNANVRHLYHLKKVDLPDLRELENEKKHKLVYYDERPGETSKRPN